LKLKLSLTVAATRNRVKGIIVAKFYPKCIADYQSIMATELVPGIVLAKHSALFHSSSIFHLKSCSLMMDQWLYPE
jgi:hypothetical protein